MLVTHQMARRYRQKCENEMREFARVALIRDGPMGNPTIARFSGGVRMAEFGLHERL